MAGKKVVNQMSDFLLKHALCSSSVPIEEKNKWKDQGLKFQSYDFNDYIRDEIKVLGDPEDW